MVAETAPRAGAVSISHSRDRAAFVAVLQMFALSGAAGLIYQVVWLRMLALTFGVTAYAVSTVLCVFFAGLGLGSLLSGRIAGRLRAPLRVYALIELVVAVLGISTPLLFGLGRELYVALLDGHSGAPLALRTLLRLLLAFLILIVPSTLMGATLPIVVQAVTRRSRSFAGRLSVLYAVNTLGAAAGCFTAGFILIGRFGLQTTLLVAACSNVLAAVFALLIERSLLTEHAGDVHSPVRSRGLAAAGNHSPPPSSPVQQVPRTALRVTTVAICVSGGVSLASEVVWTRLLASFFDATVYGFTAMLTVVLLAIVAGSWLLGLVLERRWPWVYVFAAVEAGAGLLGFLTLPLLTHLIPIGETVGLYHDPGPLGELSMRFMVFAALLVVFPPMLLLGGTFPLAARIAGDGGGVARRIGGIYALNVFGGIAGSLLGGFVLLPQLGARSSLLLLGTVNLCLAVALVWSVLPNRKVAAGLGAAAIAAAAAAVVAAPDPLRGIFSDRYLGQQVVWSDEGLENTVVVADSLATGERKMYINGQPQATTVDFIANYHRLIGHLPMVLHPQPRRALVIGLGGGATAGAVAVHSDVQVDLVELSDAVMGGARLFTGINENVLDLPNVHARVDDGRNFLLLSPGGYDVLTADIIRPEHAGASNLYSREYFALARDALAPDGLMLQWLEQLDERHYRLLLRSFVDVFPYVEMWENGSLLIGSRSPLLLDRATLARRLADPGARDSLARIGLNTPEDVLAKYTGDREEALRYLGDSTDAVTDNHPRVEFHRNLPGERRPPVLDGFSRDARKVLRGP